MLLNHMFNKISYVQRISQNLSRIQLLKETSCFLQNHAISKQIFTIARQKIDAHRLQQHAQRNLRQSTVLQKYNKRTSQDEDEDSDNDIDAEFKDERDSKVVKVKVNSLRADTLLKSGLGLARNKIEVIFYDSKIRVNGKKIPKKSQQLNIGDEIDIIRGFSQANTSHLVIARVIILSASAREEGLSVALRRYKSLLIENYSGANAYKS